MSVIRQAHTSKRIQKGQKKVDSLSELRRWTYLLQYKGLGLNYSISDKDFARECGINLAKVLEGMKNLSGAIEEMQDYIDEYGAIPESLGFNLENEDN